MSDNGKFEMHMIVELFGHQIIAGMLSDRIGSRPLLVAGMTLMTLGLGWFAVISSPTTAYALQVPPLVVSGIGMSLAFAPLSNLVLSTVRRKEEGKASGVNATVREVGGAFGVAVLASVFSAFGGYESGELFVDGMRAALWVGTAALALAAVAAVVIPPKQDVVRDSVSLLEPLLEQREAAGAVGAEAAGLAAQPSEV